MIRAAFLLLLCVVLMIGIGLASVCGRASS